MKKIITTLTAITFALGLAAGGYAQTAGKPADKPAVKTESATPAPPAATVTPAPQGTSKEAVAPVTKEADKGKAKDKGKKEEKQVSKKDKKTGTPVTETKKEEKSEVKK